MPNRIADRIAAARSRVFVGREQERSLFRAALEAPELPFYVLYVYGAGGVGKTTLLKSLADLGEGLGISSVYVDARNIDPSPTAFLEALRVALDLPEAADPVAALTANSERRVLFLDTFELLEGLDGWFRDVFVPNLPDNLLVVAAGRYSLGPAWRSDPGWQMVARMLNLRNLAPEESRDYLTRRAIPDTTHDAVLEFTHGHPLALSLIADLYMQHSPEAVAESRLPKPSPDIVQALLERFVAEVPSPVHRLALEASALVRTINEPLLTALLSDSDDPNGESPLSFPGKNSAAAIRAASLFSWLDSLSFLESGLTGIYPHDVAREALLADLRWRNHDRYTDLHRRARNFYAARLRDAPSEQQQRLLYDCIFLHRDSMVVRTAFTWTETPTLFADKLREGDAEAIVTIVERHEGPAAARAARYWLQRQPGATTVFRDTTEATLPGVLAPPIAFLTMLALEETTEEDRAMDPAAMAAWEHLERGVPLRPGEGAAHLRFWMARDTYQGMSPAQSLLIVHALRHYMTSPKLRYTFFVCQDPEFWEPVFGYVEIGRLPDAEFTLDGRQYAVFGHDWRSVPVAAWLASLAEKETNDSPSAPTSAAKPAVAPPLIVLSEPDFRAAVRDALKVYATPERIRQNPLLQSRVVTQALSDNTLANIATRIEVLRTLLRETIEAGSGSGKRLERGPRALYCTYLEGTRTQEEAAELLDLTFSTYRRHLAEGLDDLTKSLWLREIGES